MQQLENIDRKCHLLHGHGAGSFTTVAEQHQGCQHVDHVKICGVRSGSIGIVTTSSSGVRRRFGGTYRFHLGRLGMCTMAPEPIPAVNLINPSNQSVCLYVHPFSIARSFPLLSVSYQMKVID
jgi:hypothetical protein